MPAPSSAERPEQLPRRVCLAAGFMGEEAALGRPSSVWSCKTAELGEMDPFAALKATEEQLAPGEVIAGFFAYECAVAAEPSLALPTPPLGGPAAWFGVFASRGGVPPGGDERRLEPARIHEGDAPGVYGAKVEDVRTRIGRGDVFQVNVSHRQSAVYGTAGHIIDGLPWRRALEARFGAVIDLGETAIISQSPELFLSLEGRLLSTEPIKGTRPRGLTPEDDARLRDDLVNSEKDRAENIMILDLMRNDFARVCADGSIREAEICAVRSLPSVHHLTSRVEGRLADGLVFADALRACFPCGSVTGAPKLAAMQAIADIEGEGRGAYCGTVFAIGRGRATASVAIRTAIIDEREKRIDVRSGGGVTILSDPGEEYREALDKGYLFRLLTGCP